MSTSAPTVAAVGFNPFGKRATRRGDIFIVVLAFAVVAVLVLWAVFPR